jgi:hypothetical protein
MPGLSTSLLGKQQKKFRLLTEETAIKWRAPIGDVNTAAYQFESGQIVSLGSAGSLVRAGTAGTEVAIGYESIVGVAFDNYTPTINECAGAGLATVIANQHIGQTKQYDDETYNPGDKLYVSATTPGNFAATTTAIGLAYAVAERGSWLEYLWTGRQAAS